MEAKYQHIRSDKQSEYNSKGTISIYPKVYIIMCVFSPNMQLFRNQVQSILTQEHRNIELIIVFDGPSAEAEEVLMEFKDHRIIWVKESRRVGVCANFCRALKYAVSRSTSSDDLFAYSDQDDVWHQRKLLLHIAHLCENHRCTLTHSDARVVDENGSIISESMFKYEGRGQDSSLHGLMLINNVTGMTAVFRKTVAEASIKVPAQKRIFFYYDFWTAIVAASMGEIIFLDEALVDYVQHKDNVVGSGERVKTHNIRTFRFLTTSYLNRCVRQYVVRYYLYLSLELSLGRQLGETPKRPAFILKNIYGVGFYGLELVIWIFYLSLCFERHKLNQGFRIALGKLAILLEWLLSPHGIISGQSFRKSLNVKCRKILGLDMHCGDMHPEVLGKYRN